MATIEKSDKTKLVAGLLGIFLGGFGAHKFYLGDNKAAVIRIVAMLACGAGAIWGLIEGIMILANGGVDAEGRELA
jgi:TM2 domain-containing membrane protein YozV